jgi:CRISPR locus-related DNA-binding protein
MHVVKETVILSSVARNDFALNQCVKLFGASKIFIIHTDPTKTNDAEMRKNIELNLERIRAYGKSSVDEVVIDIYDFYGNARMFREIVNAHAKYRVIIDITGGDKCVTDAMIYAAIISPTADLTIVYFKREEDTRDGGPQYVIYPRVPDLSDRQKDFMFYLGDGDTIESMAVKMGTSKTNCWNHARSLAEKGLITIESGNVKPTYPSNIYSPLKRDEEKRS